MKSLSFSVHFIKTLVYLNCKDFIRQNKTKKTEKKEKKKKKKKKKKQKQKNDAQFCLHIFIVKICAKNI